MIDVTGKTRVVGVIGHPAKHSLSPLMHNAEFARLGLDYVYVAWDIEPDALAVAVAGFRAQGVAGINVTIPHKQAIMPLLDEIAPEARTIGAVNTVKFDVGKATGFNTDITGWISDIEQDIALSGRSICMIGAGGAARAVAVGAAMSGITRLVICNQPSEMEMAIALGELVRQHFPKLDVSWADSASEICRAAVSDSEIVVNATPVGMSSVPGIPIPAEWLVGGKYVYDVIYTPAETELLHAAKARGCRVRNGLGMLARQGAKAFEIWTDVAPDAHRMEDILRTRTAGK
jgi:shikimate dehydrogenase